MSPIHSSTKFKFILIGGWNTVAGYLLFVFFNYLFSQFIAMRFLAYTTAMIVAQIISISQAFVLHKTITFQSKARGKELFKEFARFVTTYIGLCIAAPVLLPIFVELFNIHPNIAAGIVTVIIAVTSYFGHSRFSFRLSTEKDIQ